MNPTSFRWNKVSLLILIGGSIIEVTVTVVTVVIIIMMEALSYPCCIIAFYSWFSVSGLLFFVNVYAVQGLECFFFFLVKIGCLGWLIFNYSDTWISFCWGGNGFMLLFLIFLVCRVAWFLGFLTESAFVYVISAWSSLGIFVSFWSCLWFCKCKEAYIFLSMKWILDILVFAWYLILSSDFLFFIFIDMFAYCEFVYFLCVWLIEVEKVMRSETWLEQ